MKSNVNVCEKSNMLQELADRFYGEIFSLARTTGDLIDSNDIYIISYVLYKASIYENPFSISLKAIDEGALDINDFVRNEIVKTISEKSWELLLPLLNKYSSKMIADFIVMSTEYYDTKVLNGTPKSISELGCRALDIQPDEKVANICCGRGSFLITAATRQNNASYFGYEIDERLSTIASIRAEFVKSNIQVNTCDAFSLVEEGEEKKFDKIFSNYPFGLRLRYLDKGTEYFEKLYKKYPSISKVTSSDWVFNALLCDLLSENGKAVAIMTNGSTRNSVDAPIRKYFVENKLIESIISLPAKMFSYTNIETTLIVLSKNNEFIRMVDATNIVKQGRRQNEFSDENLETIIDALNSDSEFSKKVTIDELRENEYVLNLSRYLSVDLDVRDGAPFERVIKSISRGAPCTASQLDEMVSEHKTDIQYLMLGNIQNGIIEENLPYLAKLEPKYEKFCIKNNSLILSKNGYPYKIAVATVEEGKRILANGNLFVIELDEEQANPYYIKAFFESELGVKTLENITVGSVIPNISMDKLRKVAIPLPSMDEQNRIALNYRLKLDEIAKIKKQLEKAQNELSHVFDIE